MKKQKAEIGQKIIITNTFEENDFVNGEVLTVIGFWDERNMEKDFFGVIVDKCNQLGDMWVDEEEYELYLDSQ